MLILNNGVCDIAVVSGGFAVWSQPDGFEQFATNSDSKVALCIQCAIERKVLQEIENNDFPRP